ncbi:MAG TPA: SAM-dependent methyltransferase [Gemmatimonadales bacterium]|nr:SAM-dependent methyltransferase [Gemmatimonadales bacterium]
MTVTHPVARTAFYCCAIRADDAVSPHPVCGDALAARFLDEDTRRGLEPVLRLPAPAASNVARHRLIDDLLRRMLAEDLSRRVFVLGAGFDTRAFRLTGGRWWEIDDPTLLAFKEERLPARGAPNPLTRVSVDFQSERLADRLAPLAGDDRAVVVLEGVTMYLDQDVLAALARDLRAALPRATLICDLMSPTFAATFSRAIRRELGRLGATFGRQRRHPRRSIERAGYTARSRHSIAGRAQEAGTLRAPSWLLDTVLRGLRDGYAVWVFEPAPEE